MFVVCCGCRKISKRGLFHIEGGSFLKQPIYNTALYLRLSRDDKTYGDSVSIETQRAILQQYAQDNGLHVVDEYVDDGWSGTNFERPDFRRMMKDIELGKVNCVVTKNLSRFGREHIMMDYYLEFIFPEKRVRYIAVAENEDTEKVLSDFVPFMVRKGHQSKSEGCVTHQIQKQGACLRICHPRIQKRPVCQEPDHPR
mgnify:CR=1 FL=1